LFSKKVSLAGQNAQTTASKRKLEEERVIAIAKLRQENAQLRVKVTEARLVKTELDAARAELRKAVTNADANEARAKHAVAALEAVSRGKTGDAKTVVDLELRLASATREASDAAAAACAAQTALAEKQTETDAFMAEMEAIGAAYEDAANDNERLMERLAERDAGVTKAVTEKNQAQLSVRRLRDDLQGMEAAVKHERGAAQVRISPFPNPASLFAHTRLTLSFASYQAALARANAIERGFDEANFEIKNAKDAAALASLQMATQTKTLTEAHEASEQRKFLLQAAEQKVEALLLTSKDDAAKVTECERKLQKCEETCAGLKRRNEKLAKHGGSAEEYKEEIDAYKQMLRCSVCNDRPKGVIITRCFHMFCNDCIAIRLENRARKCPGCGLMFSASDVKAIFF
jgi:E3 ubiquitin-protein ligase BRE1|tara:strand:- start:3464 stop:4675 length:1212 start_codon:yes stop_codon:yes gene_type:complete